MVTYGACGDISEMCDPTPGPSRPGRMKGAVEGEVECLPYPSSRAWWRKRSQTSSSFSGVMNCGGMILD